MTRSLFLLTSFLFLAGCIQKRPVNPVFTEAGRFSEEPVLFADGFTLQTGKSNALVSIINPWQNAQNVKYSYFLSDTLKQSQIIDESHWFIKTPVKRVVCLSTTHIGFIGFINESASIVGISGKNYVVNEELRSKISRNQLPDVGYDENLNYELILKLKPDVVLAYGVSGTITNTVRKLNELGIPAILIAEYLEEEPLAKMEWIKVFGALYGCKDLAMHKFDSVANQYKQLALLAGKAGNKPTVLLGLPWRGSWYISGGQSYIARLVSDAGGEYIFNDLMFNESRPIALEKVFERALHAEFWLNSGDALTKSDLFSVDERFIRLSPVFNDHVYNNNNRVSPSGGNAFYESGVVEPEIILSDLIYILHPQLLPSHQLKYYRKLQ
jgi:iron complex transport system substrate-binding protein